MRCDFDDCTNEGVEDMVFLNPNIVPPPDTGQQFYKACRQHSLELTDD